MLDYIKGRLVVKEDSFIVVENNDIGYRVAVPQNSSFYLSEIGEDIKIYTYMIVKEDELSLCGFADRAEHNLFTLLMTVSGVGAKAAMSILSCGTNDDIRKAIVFEDINFITRAQGIGKKSAQRIVLELKDKVGANTVFSGGISSGGRGVAVDSVMPKYSPKEEAVVALMELGYTRMEAMTAIDRATNNVDGELTVEDYIKRALGAM
ncbi:MAG: Holliday junction branch migration protein RuvA [Eubacteriales bacterium]|nr:Holliday junction branch migration protein RuvA [Eubacteriales bacterium]MDY3332867.1 Holliday junction branch migration protein RuvA [Gallibacter sp.]